MVRPDLTKWNQSIDDLLQGSINAQHPRTRERYLALYMIASGQSNATLWAKQTNRCDESIMKWVHRYNEFGNGSRMATCLIILVSVRSLGHVEISLVRIRRLSTFDCMKKLSPL